MLALSFAAPVAGTNCYVLATGHGQDCLVVDPGIGVYDQLGDILREQRLRPAAVLLTHGHLDHVFAVTPVCGASGAAAYINSGDRYRLRDPVGSLGPGFAAMIEQQFGRQRWQEPDDVVEIGDGSELDLAGLRVSVTHAPGHTEGSVLFALSGVPDTLPAGVRGAEAGSTVLSGDVVFAGSVGRTDLPGGDGAAMQRSLRDVVLPLPDDALLLPGHGPATTMGRERATNPFLRDLAPRTHR